MWSTVATVRDGNGTFQPRARSISKACGLVTSWTRCRPTKSWVCPVGSFRTVWRSQTFENRVAGMAFSSRRSRAGGAGRRSAAQERQLEPLHETSHLGSRRHFGFERNSEQLFPLDRDRSHPLIHQPLEESVMDLAGESWRGGLVVLHGFPELLGGADGFASEGFENVAGGCRHRQLLPLLPHLVHLIHPGVPSVRNSTEWEAVCIEKFEPEIRPPQCPPKISSKKTCIAFQERRAAGSL